MYLHVYICASLRHDIYIYIYMYQPTTFRWTSARCWCVSGLTWGAALDRGRLAICTRATKTETKTQKKTSMAWAVLPSLVGALLIASPPPPSQRTDSVVDHRHFLDCWHSIPSHSQEHIVWRLATLPGLANLGVEAHAKALALTKGVEWELLALDEDGWKELVSAAMGEKKRRVAL